VLVIDSRCRNAGRPEEFKQVRLFQVDDQRSVGLLGDLIEALRPVGISHGEIDDDEAFGLVNALFCNFLDLLFAV